MNAEEVTTGSIEPGDNDDYVAGPDVAQTFEHVGLEHQPAFGRAFIGLARAGADVLYRRLDPTDHTQIKVVLAAFLIHDV